jgi:hypothetical protein
MPRISVVLGKCFPYPFSGVKKTSPEFSPSTSITGVPLPKYRPDSLYSGETLRRKYRASRYGSFPCTVSGVFKSLQTSPNGIFS